MILRFPGGGIAVAGAALALLTAFQVAGKPEDEFAGIVKAYLGMSLPSDWDGLDKLPQTKWAPVAPTMLKNCLPDGGCFALQGTATLGGRNLSLVASGARTMVFHLYFRNAGTPLGEAEVLAALKQTGFSADLVRCPVRVGVGGTNWYRLKGPQLSPGHLSIQAPAPGRPTEGFVLSQGEELDPLQPNQLALYSESCGTVAERKPVATTKPHEQLAEAIKTLLPSSGGPVLYDWKALAGLASGISWDSGGPKRVNLSFKNDPNPLSQTGSAAYAQRKFSLLVSGTPIQVKTIYFDEGGMHPRGEHMLGVLYEKGLTVKLVRCGPVYTESTSNWYSVTSATTRPVMVQQSIRYEGNQVQDSYAVRLDGSLPTRDPRDRNPGVGGC
jgi:hypothetical protein